MRGRLGPQAGTPKRLLKPAWTAAYGKGRGPKDPTVRREGTREPPASWRHLVLRVVAATAGAQCQTVGEVRPTSLPSASTVFTVSAWFHSTDAKHRVPPISYFLRRSSDSVHRQSAELPCCASETSYLQCYCSKDRRVPTDTVIGQVDDIRCCSTIGAWL